MFKNSLIIIIGLGLDYFSKLWVVNKLIYSQAIEVFSTKFGGINLYLTYNSGIAFGLFNDPSGDQNIIFAGLTGIAVFSITYVIIRNKILDHIERLGMLLILSGAAGNFIDRIIYSKVIDFIDCYLVLNHNYLHWYTFNVADSLICVGTALFIYRNFRINPTPVKVIQ